MSIKNNIYKAAIFSAILPVVKKEINAEKINALDLILISNFKNTGKAHQVLKVNFLQSDEEKTHRVSKPDEGMSDEFFKKICSLLPPKSEIISLHIKQDAKGKNVFLNYKEKEETKQIIL
jgi:hypothetical protein